MAQLRSGSRPGHAPRKGAAVGLAVGAAVAVGVGLYALVPNMTDDQPGGDPCLDAAGVAVFVLHLRQPLRQGWTAAPGALLRDVALRLPPATELRVQRISARPESPLAPVARLCLPRGRTPACTGRARTSHAGRREALYCARLDAVVQQVDELATGGGRLEDSAPLAEAIDQAHRELERARGHRSLHLVSDMLQHAPWYSHLEVPPDRWDDRAFAERRRSQGRGLLEYRDSLPAEVFYMPRDGMSAARPAREAHQAFWRRHFLALGMSVAFHDQPVMPGVRMRRNGPSQLEQLARQRQLLDAERVARDAARQRLEDARTQLAELRTRTASERAALAEQRRGLEDEQAVEQRIADDARATSARLEAALAVRQPPNAER